MPDPSETVHIPVLLKHIMQLFQYSPQAVVVDATVGQGGHALALAGKLDREGLFIGLDIDEKILAVAQERLKGLSCRVELVRENFSRLATVLQELDIAQVDIILADLGMCSAQIGNSRKGLSFQEDMPLDMRLDDRLEITASDLVNRLREKDLADLIYRYGEERKSRRIARQIVATRKRKPIKRTSDLVAVINRCLGISGSRRKYKIHPATRTFQALRIAVNRELENLQQLLDDAPDLLKTGGHIGVISFHSLEDRIVKNDFRRLKDERIYEILTKKPIIAAEDERKINPRSRSAKLRVARKI